MDYRDIVDDMHGSPNFDREPDATRLVEPDVERDGQEPSMDLQIDLDLQQCSDWQLLL